MEYINEFHKEWIERTRKSIEEWKKHPPTREEVLEQQETFRPSESYKRE